MSSTDSGMARGVAVGLANVAAFLLSTEALALDVQAQFNVGVGRTDNIARTADNEIEETLGVAGMNIRLTEDSRRVTADLRSQIDYFYYADGTFDDEWVGGLSAFLDFVLVDERVTWSLNDTFGQQSIDPLSPVNPGNRENVNFFTTGPTVNLFPASRNLARISLTYSSVDYEERDVDNERTSAMLSLGREIRRGATLSLNGSTTRVEYDNDGLSPDFDRHEGFARYEFASERNTFLLDLGVTEINIDGETGDGVLGRMTWSRLVSTGTTFELSAGSQYSDQGDIFRIGQNAAGDLRDTSDIINSPAPFTNNFFSLAYNVTRERTALSIGMNWNQEDFDDAQGFDRDVSAITLNVTRDLSPSLYGGFGYQFRRRDFKTLDVVDDNTQVSLDFGYRFSPAASVSAQYVYFDRSGDNAFSVATENRVFLRFFYTPRWGVARD